MNKDVLLEWGKTIAIVVGLVFAIQTIAFASFHIPSESMAPTLTVGDRVVVTKFSYGYSRHSVPFSLAPSLPTKSGRIIGQIPSRGDIVVFRHTRDDITMIKRVIGLPGDRVQVKQGQLHLNGELVEREKSREYTYTTRNGQSYQVREYIEQLPDGPAHTIIEIAPDSLMDNTREYTVPEGHLFMMGDNRDMSSDSRFLNKLGFVPFENLMGRAQVISYSLHNCAKKNPDICNSSRILKRLK